MFMNNNTNPSNGNVNVLVNMVFDYIRSDVHSEEDFRTRIFVLKALALNRLDVVACYLFRYHNDVSLARVSIPYDPLRKISDFEKSNS